MYLKFVYENLFLHSLLKNVRKYQMIWRTNVCVIDISKTNIPMELSIFFQVQKVKNFYLSVDHVNSITSKIPLIENDSH